MSPFAFPVGVAWIIFAERKMGEEATCVNTVGRGCCALVFRNYVGRLRPPRVAGEVVDDRRVRLPDRPAGIGSFR